MIFTALALATPSSTSFIGFPPGASGDRVCEMYVVTDGSDRAAAVLLADCPWTFAKRIRKALKTWKWEPAPAHVEHWKVHFFEKSPYAKHKQVGELDGDAADWVRTVGMKELTLVEKVDQKYPAHAAGKSGKCVADLWIDGETGGVSHASVDQCEPVFHDVTLTAVHAWKFAPFDDSRWARTKILLSYEEPADIPANANWLDVLERIENPSIIMPPQSKRFRPATCTLIFTVGLDGKAGKAESIEGCPGIFRIPSENGIRRMRWKHLGEPTPQRIQVMVTFPKKAP